MRNSIKATAAFVLFFVIVIVVSPLIDLPLMTVQAIYVILAAMISFLVSLSIHAVTGTQPMLPWARGVHRDVLFMSAGFRC